MPINRILAAQWSGVWSTGTQTIEMTKLENVDPALTYRDDLDVPFSEAQQYDVYCFAMDSAVDDVGNPRKNYMTQDYVGTDAADTSAPEGGRTANVWVQLYISIYLSLSLSLYIYIYINEITIS